MDLLLRWLLDLNVFMIFLTAWATSYITTKAHTKQFDKAIQATQASTSQIISEIRGQSESIRGKIK